MPNKLNLLCSNYPSDKQLKIAKRFGEGFTWTCPSCFEQLVLAQGKGKHWHWEPWPPDIFKVDQSAWKKE